MTASAIVLTVVAVWAVIWFGQRWLVYFPSSGVPSTLAVGLTSAEVVTLTTRDGLALGAWFVPPAAAWSGYAVIVFGGNAGHRGYRAPLAARLARTGLAVLLFDYRGYGDNPGLPHEAGFARDAEAALQYLRSRPDIDEHRIVFFGESLGAAVAVSLAATFAPAALILRSPFSSMQAMAHVHLSIHAPRWLLRDRYDSLHTLTRIRSPLLVIAGDADTVVPLDDSMVLYEAAHEPKRLVVIEGADHNDAALMNGPRVIAAVAEWLGL